MPLKRTLTLPLVTFYGLGSIIGAGIYALIGTVAHEAKLFTTVSFFIASIIALFTAASYAELSSRFPQSAGSSLYVKKAFNKTWLSGLVGWLVVATGVVSSGALIHGLINYLQLYFSISLYIQIPVIVLILGGITILGITESALTIFIMTLLEVCGLLILIWYGKAHYAKAFTHFHQYFPSYHIETWIGILNGSFIAFYAFIGFEDMVNLAEETVKPEKTMPLAIFIAAISATLLYILVSFVTVASLDITELTTAKTPLALIIKDQGHSPVLFSLIAMLSIANGILVNIIMASRLIYGMTKLKNAPKIFSIIYEKTQVPLFATLLVMGIVIILALWFPIATLARITSTIMLCVFCIMHLSLIIIKISHSKAGPDKVSVPMILPVMGLILSVVFLIASLA